MIESTVHTNSGALSQHQLEQKCLVRLNKAHVKAADWSVLMLTQPTQDGSTTDVLSTEINQRAAAKVSTCEH